MPNATIWSLRATLVWFAVGITVGATMLVDTATGAVGLGPAWTHAHMHVLLFGWLVQTIFAIAFWMLPRFGGKRPRAILAHAALVLLNVATIVALFAPVARVHEFTLVTETLAVVSFAAHAWPRVKRFGA